MDDLAKLKAAAAKWLIPDDLWESMQLLIPEHVNTHPFGGGKPRTPDRVCLEAISGLALKARDGIEKGRA